MMTQKRRGRGRPKGEQPPKAVLALRVTPELKAKVMKLPAIERSEVLSQIIEKGLRRAS